MKNLLIEYLIRQKTPCIFLSPHFDDAIFSCGALLEQLQGKVETTVINVFTSAHDGPYTISAHKYLNSCGFPNDAIKLYEARDKEDLYAIHSVSAKRINLGLQDAIFRRKQHTSLLGRIIPELDHVYPTYRWHATKSVASHDQAVPTLKKLLMRLVGDTPRVIFAPFGIGGHVDHLLVRLVAQDIFPNAILYSDFPYNHRLNYYGEPSQNQKKVTVQVDYEIKKSLMYLYKTQMSALFSTHSVPNTREIYFMPKNV